MPYNMIWDEDNNRWKLDYTITSLKKLKFLTAGKKSADLFLTINPIIPSTDKKFKLSFNYDLTFNSTTQSGYGYISISSPSIMRYGYLNDFEDDPSGTETQYNKFTNKWYDYNHILLAYGDWEETDRVCTINLAHNSYTVNPGNYTTASVVPGLYIILGGDLGVDSVKNTNCKITFYNSLNPNQNRVITNPKWFKIAPSTNADETPNKNIGVSVYYSNYYWTTDDPNTQERRIYPEYNVMKIENTGSKVLRVLKLTPTVSITTPN